MTEQGSHLPALQRLLAAGKHLRQAEPINALLCQMLGVSRQADWPLAALGWLGEGENPATDYWLRADPVNFALQRDYFTLSDPVPLPLSQQEARSLLATLNQHFAVEGLQFQLGNSGGWYLHLQTPPGITTTLAETAIGRDVSTFLPQGSGMAKWNQLLNEIQMLLHEHPVNQVRESAGQLSVNSLWFSGGGILPGVCITGIKTVFADQPLAKGLAKMAQVPHFPLPDNTMGLQNVAGNDVLLVVEHARAAEQKWFSPLLAVLKARKTKQLVFHFAVRDQVLSVTVTPNDLWKFWRKIQPLEDYFMANIR